ncbi:MAG: hypothetical protein ED556_13015 [Winogradskyella sp.]|nr:MAG: hypothetical protein ED556_13015 [Winogradskyella sp.]
MRFSILFNLILYITVVSLYIYQPILGALTQIGLGIFQFVFAITLLDNNQFSKRINKKALRFYFILVFVWFISIIISLFNSSLNHENYSITILLVIPMIIGLYFVIVTILTLKKHKNENSNT